MSDEWKPMDNTPIVRSPIRDGYDANKSQIGDQGLANWLENELDPDIESVPGIGPATAAKIATGDDGVQTTHQLIGRFLTLKAPEAECKYIKGLFLPTFLRRTAHFKRMQYGMSKQEGMSICKVHTVHAIMVLWLPFPNFRHCQFCAFLNRKGVVAM